MTKMKMIDNENNKQQATSSSSTSVGESSEKSSSSSTNQHHDQNQNPNNNLVQLVNSTSPDSNSARIRSLSQGPRNKSRAELLARRQQLAAASQSPSGQLGWAPTSNSNNNDDQHQDAAVTNEDSIESNSGAEDDYSLISRAGGNHHQSDGRSSRSHKRGSNNRGLSAEAKLESLSEQLKLHQATNWNSPTSPLHSGAEQVDLSSSAAANIENVYILLAKKDKDLQFAAEVGKVLLEKNDELSKANEQQAEQYSRKLELLEEEKHKLRRRLDQLEGEYENRLIEAQTDCRLLEAQLESQRQETSRREREKSRLIDELGQQAQRLSAELAEATRSEELLNAQVEQLKERLSTRGSQRQDQDIQVEALKSEIEIVTQRKQDLERRLRLATDELAQLNGALGESGERILVLESLLSERDSRLRDADGELSELRDATGWLSGQLDAMISLNERLAAANNNNSTSGNATFASGSGEPLELEALGMRSQLIEQLRELRLRTRARTKASEMKLLNHHHHQRPLREATSGVGQKKSMFKKRTSTTGRAGGSTSSTDVDDGPEVDGTEAEAETETTGHDTQSMTTTIGLGGDNNLASSIYKLLKQFQAQLERRRAELNWRQQQLSNNSSKPNNGSTTSGTTSGTTSATSPITVTTTAPVSSNQLSTPTDVAMGPSTSTSTFSTSAQSSVGADDSGISGYDDNNSSSSEDANNSRLAGNSLELTSETEVQDPVRWRTMLGEIQHLVDDLPCKTCHIMINEGQKHERLSRDFARISEELRKCEEQRLQLSALKTELEAKVEAVEEKCSTLKSDLESGGQQPDEIVRLAWQRRDEAVSRKNACEIALAKSRIENMQLSSQLMEVVQQKSQLAQQVAQFEDDMHYMTQYSVKAKFSWEEQAERLRREQQKARNQQQQQSSSSVVGGLSLGPLSSLLGNFTTSVAPQLSSSRPNSGGGNSSSSGLNNNQSIANDNGVINETVVVNAPQDQLKSSIMRNFATSRLKLTRFWSKAEPQASNESQPLPPVTATTTTATS